MESISIGVGAERERNIEHDQVRSRGSVRCGSDHRRHEGNAPDAIPAVKQQTRQRYRQHGHRTRGPVRIDTGSSLFSRFRHSKRMPLLIPNMVGVLK